MMHWYEKKCVSLLLELVTATVIFRAVQGNPVKDRSCTRSCNLHSNYCLQPQKPLSPGCDGKAMQARRKPEYLLMSTIVEHEASGIRSEVHHRIKG